MKRIAVIPLLFALMGVSFLSFGKTFTSNKNYTEPEFAKPGMVACAASYSDSASNEPNYSTQNSKTFQYLNLGNTLERYRGDSVKVGIIDSGINYDHEDFMVDSQTKVEGSSKYYAYSNSSWVYYGATSHGYSYIDDTLGHGTNVAATVAAAINSVGGSGLAPNVELYVYKVTNSNNGYEFGAIQNALLDAKTLGLDVINMSFQSYENAVTYGSSTMSASSGCSSILTYYLNQAYNAGITLVGAAGNYNTSEPSYPGSNNHVINVGSLSSDGTAKAPFSNYGSTIDLVAPGYVYVADESSNTAYTNTQGTSFSAPLVTAAIALYIQQNPSATPDEIETALYASCDAIDDSGSEYTNWAGNGSLNVAKFLGVVDDAPTSITIDNSEIENEYLELNVGDTFDLQWTVNGTGSFDDSVNIYALDNNGALSVDNSGHITALAEGSDYIVVESVLDSSIYASVYIDVVASTSSRTVIETTTISLSSTISWPSSASPSISGDLTNVTAVASGKTVYEESSLRLGTSKGGGTITISANETITKVDVVAKYYSSSYSSSILKVDGQSVNPLTANYASYTVTLETGKTSFTVLTQNSSSRVNIQSITLYSITSTSTDISNSDDCLGLESFIKTYMHMDYVENLGYCKDETHHYYSTAKAAFNSLNNHQRSLFVSNSAYANEYARLSAWASANGDSLDSNNMFAMNSRNITSNFRSFNSCITIIVAMLATMSVFTLVFYLVKKKKDN